MDRRGFLRLLGSAAIGAAVQEAIPFNRVWSFPKAIKIVPYASVESYLASLHTALDNPRLGIKIINISTPRYDDGDWFYKQWLESREILTKGQVREQWPNILIP
jgi:hypothetical protein